MQPAVGWRATGRDGEIGASDTTSKTDQVEKGLLEDEGCLEEKAPTFKWLQFLFNSRLLHENPNKPRCYPQQRLGNNASKENLHARLFPNT